MCERMQSAYLTPWAYWLATGVVEPPGAVSLFDAPEEPHAASRSPPATGTTATEKPWRWPARNDSRNRVSIWTRELTGPTNLYGTPDNVAVTSLFGR